MPSPDPLMLTRAKLARLYQAGKTPDPEVAAAIRREIKEIEIERFVRAKLATAPPLTEVQCARLALLLRGNS